MFHRSYHFVQELKANSLTSESGAKVASVMRKIADYLTKDRSEKEQKNRPKHTRKRIHQAKKNFLEKFKTAS